MGLLEILGLPAVKKIIDVIASYIPLTQDQKSRLEVELSKTSVEVYKAKSEYVKSLGTRIRDAIIPAILGWYLIANIINFLTAWVFTLRGKGAFSIAIGEDYKTVVMTIIGFLFTYKGVSKFTDK
ncbi:MULTISPECIES: hypothetical protein [unclassified Fusobacterium]|uniref:hypothetical protein n=1 Tax=unclassified Fusobacterium TaxID=2648384 RepID=UPI001B8CE59C|nr:MULTISPECIES: hypothetical protein [unclassified Fusobacterium]MBR8701489.1 hypothetical protein [Fusobacterium sp. DD45]MBR8711732.1 hypothetical protein [Fusobacterium sp. DD28]MBR8752279.1 hypothetical protein [Fusobacterium sp. DD26]